jgi:hypothetical protein
MAEALPDEVRIASDERVGATMSGLLVSVVGKAREIKFFETLTEGLALKQKSVVYSQQNRIETIAASVAVGCRHTSEIQTRLVPDRVAAELFGMTRFPDQSQINGFLRACGPRQVAHLEAAHARLLRDNSRVAERSRWWKSPTGKRLLTIDLDQTPLVTRGTTATGATRGYFGRKRGQLGYKKSVALLGGSLREILWQRLGPGHEHGQDAVAPALAAMRDLAAAHGLVPHELLWRADSQYGSTVCVRQFQAAGHHYLLKGYASHTAQHVAESLDPSAVWTSLGTDSYGSRLWVVDAGQQDLRGHDDPAGLPPVQTRVILLVRVRWSSRKKHGRGAPDTIPEKHVSCEHYLTDLPSSFLTPAEVIATYNGRESQEGLFQSEQDIFGADHLRTRHQDGEAVFLWILASTINLLRWVQHSTFEGTPVEHLGLHRLVTDVIHVPATVIRQVASWTLQLPALAWITRHIANLRLPTFAIQASFAFSYGDNSP